MTEEEFWKIVDSVGWPTNTDFAKAKLMRQYDQSVMGEFAEMAGKKAAALLNALEAYEREVDGGEYFLSDDGASDMTMHVVGLGKEVYDKSLANPELLAKRASQSDFEESFLYCIPNTGTSVSRKVWVEVFCGEDIVNLQTEFDLYVKNGWLKDALNRTGIIDGEVPPAFTLEDVNDHIDKKYAAARLGDWSLINDDYWRQVGADQLQNFVEFFMHPEVESQSRMQAGKLMDFWGAVGDGNFKNAGAMSEDAMYAWWWLYFCVIESGAYAPNVQKLLPQSRLRHSGECLINDFRSYMLDLERFKSRHHYNIIVEGKS